ncbi:MAG TPA: hypothetical protein VN493_20465 [Thermoanaerobaculia bacterium]|nr:hypothetical protein [Thermoanaerobaculia bacterium]
MTRLDELLNQTYEIVHWTENCGQVWWLYEGEDTLPQVRSILERYSYALSVSKYAFASATITGIGKLYDKQWNGQKDSLSLRRLVTEAKRDPRISAECADSLESALAEAEELAKPALTIRHKRVAHHGITDDIQAILKEAKLSHGDIQTLLEQSRSIVEKIARALGVNYSMGNPAKRYAEMWLRLAELTISPNQGHAVDGYRRP